MNKSIADLIIIMLTVIAILPEVYNVCLQF